MEAAGTKLEADGGILTADQSPAGIGDSHVMLQQTMTDVGQSGPCAGFPSKPKQPREL